MTPAWFSWARPVFSLELRKIFSYRVDFWVNFLTPIFGELVVAYFLWKSIFDYLGQNRLGGFTLNGMVFYYLLGPLTDRVIRGPEWRDFICRDIFDGTLTRYLVYPISFFGYKFVARSAQTLVAVVQLVVMVSVFIFVFGLPKEVSLSAFGVISGFGAALVGIVLYFALAAALEMVAFWMDAVWSLLVMLRFSIYMLGAGIMPLSLYPAALAAVLKVLPFYYLMAFPVRCWLGQIGFQEWAGGIAIGLAWTGVFALVSARVWKSGTRQYSGVGM